MGIEITKFWLSGNKPTPLGVTWNSYLVRTCAEIGLNQHLFTKRGEHKIGHFIKCRLSENRKKDTGKQCMTVYFNEGKRKQYENNCTFSQLEGHA